MGLTMYFSLLGAGLCNNRCLFCDEGFHTYRLTYDDVIKKIEEYGLSRGDKVIFSGGEPTLHDDILQLIKYASQRGIYVYMQSNGRKFSDYDFALSCIKAGLRRILIPIYGSTPTIHDHLTQCRGSYMQTIRGLKNLFELKEKYTIEIEINTVICKTNINDIFSILKLIKNRFSGVKFFRLCALNFSDATLKHFNKIGIKLSDGKDIIKKTVNMAIADEIQIAIDYIPLCILGDKRYAEIYIKEREDSVWEPFVIGYDAMHKQEWISPYTQFKAPQCKLCEYDSICKGVYKRYAYIFGVEELTPFIKYDKKREGGLS